MCLLSRPSLVFSRPLSRVCAPAPTVLRVFVLSILVGGAPCFGRVLARYQCWTRHRVCLLLRSFRDLRVRQDACVRDVTNDVPGPRAKDPNMRH